MTDSDKNFPQETDRLGDSALTGDTESIPLASLVFDHVAATPGSVLDSVLRRVRNPHSEAGPFVTGHSEGE